MNVTRTCLASRLSSYAILEFRECARKDSFWRSPSRWSCAFAGMTAAYGEEKDKRNNDPHTASPIKHLIIILGENRTFDHVFGVYKPRQGETISNLLSKGIVKEDGTPGPNFSRHGKFTTFDRIQLPSSVRETRRRMMSCRHLSFSAQPNVASPIHAAAPASRPRRTLPILSPISHPPICTSSTTGASGLLTTRGVDTRVLNAISLPNGPFQLTGPNACPMTPILGDPIHRFYQMWQQSDCSIKTATASNPSGCLSDLYPFVAPSSFSAVNEGGTSMAFQTCLRGDAPYLRQLADEYAMNDNYHQSQMGGTMVEHFYGHG